MISKPYAIFIVPKRENYLKGSIPLGLLSVATAVKDLIDLAILDLNLKESNLDKSLKLRKPIFYAISNNYTINNHNFVKLVKQLKLKYPKIPIISGGTHSTFEYKNILEQGTDYVVMHEGEATFRDLVKYLISKNKKKLSKIRGISYKKNKKIYLNKNRPLIKNLDKLPIPDYTLLGPEFQKYYFYKYRIIETSRGCTYNCSFCSDNSMWGNRWRAKSPERVLKEFLKAKKDSIHLIAIGDANMSNNPENVKKICSLLNKHNLDVPWSSNHRADTIYQNPDLIFLMKISGCKMIRIGFESMNKRVLDYYNKKTTPFMNLKVLKIIKKNKLISIGNHIIGAPDESLKEMLNTIIFSFKHNFPGISILKNYPSSNLNLKKPKDYTNFKESNIHNPSKIVGFLQKFSLAIIFLSPKRLFTLFSQDKAIRIKSRIIYTIHIEALKKFLRL